MKTEKKTKTQENHLKNSFRHLNTPRCVYSTEEIKHWQDSSSIKVIETLFMIPEIWWKICNITKNYHYVQTEFSLWNNALLIEWCLIALINLSQDKKLTHEINEG